MQFDLTADERTDGATDAVAPGTSCVFPCSVDTYMCTCPDPEC